ncbi:MAG: DUF3592 domain-containing protein [Anaerolineae bacterium]
MDFSSTNKSRSNSHRSREEQEAHYRRLRQQLESGQMDGKPRPKPWPLTVLGVLLIVAAFGLGIVGILQISKVKQGGDWPAVTATITKTYISSTWNDSRKKYDYEIGAYYNYSVGGSSYQYNTTVDHYTSRAGAEMNLQRYVGQKTTLYYDPSHPDIALPFPGGSAFSVVLVVVAGLALVAGIFFFMTGGQPLRRA